MFPTREPVTGEPLIIPPRRNYVMFISADELIEYKFVTVKNHEINDTIIIDKCISSVIGNQTSGNIKNISEEPFIIDQINTLVI